MVGSCDTGKDRANRDTSPRRLLSAFRERHFAKYDKMRAHQQAEDSRSVGTEIPDILGVAQVSPSQESLASSAVLVRRIREKHWLMLADHPKPLAEICATF